MEQPRSQQCRSKELGRRWKNSPKQLLHRTLFLPSHNVWVDFGFITSLPPNPEGGGGLDSAYERGGDARRLA